MWSTNPPTSRDTIVALRVIARELGADCAWQHDGAFVFDLGGGWALRVRPDSAARFRLSACYGTAEVASLWSRVGDMGRLAALARSLQADVAALTA
jgi:hypothetical protein